MPGITPENGGFAVPPGPVAAFKTTAQWIDINHKPFGLLLRLITN